jgi:hypothetical protein
MGLLRGYVLSRVGAADMERARLLFSSGQYAECITKPEDSCTTGRDEEALLLLSQALLMTGQYQEARAAITNSLAQDSRSLRLRWQAREVFQCNWGRRRRLRNWSMKSFNAGRRVPGLSGGCSKPGDFGRALLLRGLDPKRVLDTVFENARKLNPKLKDLYLPVVNWHWTNMIFNWQRENFRKD